MLTHKGTKILTTERLILRRFKVSDNIDMYNNWANDERVTKYLTWQPHKSADATKDLLDIWCNEYLKPDYYQWAIEMDGKVIGSICVVRSSEKDEYAELGYCIGFDYWNKGIMSEAVTSVTDFLFSEIGYNRISISHATKNISSGKVAQKCLRPCARIYLL